MKESYLWLPGAMILSIILTIGFVLVVVNRPRESTNPCTVDHSNCYSIQGEGSQPGCPNQHIETVDVNGQSFFLGCYGSTDQ